MARTPLTESTERPVAMAKSAPSPSPESVERPRGRGRGTAAEAVVAPSKTPKQLTEALRTAELELALVETTFNHQMMARLLEADDRQVVDNESDGWTLLSSGGRLTTERDLTGLFGVVDLPALRKASYRAWRFNPHARGIIRSFIKYLTGRGFSLDFQDTQTGTWNADKTKVVVSDAEDASPLMALVWDDFCERNNFAWRLKEIVCRTLRDGDMLLRRFPRGGRVWLRFIAPAHVKSPDGPAAQTGEVTPEDMDPAADLQPWFTPGDPTRIEEGIEYLADDVETVVAYHTPDATEKRIAAHNVIHAKCSADADDLRGFPLLEPVLPVLADYKDWEKYRLILNKVRTAIVLVRKVEGTQTQANAIVAARQSVRSAPSGRSPQTGSGRREAMFQSPTVLTPGPGVSYDMMSANLQASDAQHDGRRLLLTAAAGVGLPEQVTTQDFSNSAYASTQAAQDAVQREWEDWQDFFTPVVRRIVAWVREEAIKELGLPEDTDPRVEIIWPTILQKDALKETQRRAALHASQIMSARTWATEEGLDYDAEMQNMADDVDVEPEDETVPPDDEGEQGRGEGDQTPVEARIQRVNQAILALSELDRQRNTVSAGPLREAVDRFLEPASAYLTKTLQTLTEHVAKPLSGGGSIS